MKTGGEILIVSLFALLLLGGCGVYSFTGASIPAEAKTVSVQYFPNTAQLVNPLLSPMFTEALRNKMMNQTSLDMVDSNGDLMFEGEIVDYKTTPVAITATQTAALNRLTITVNVRYVNTIDETKNFETRFSRYEDYPSEQDLNTVQETVAPTIIDALVEDIFNKALVNW